MCGIFCATANPVEVLVAETALGRAITGVVDGSPPLGAETPAEDAQKLLRTIGYQL